MLQENQADMHKFAPFFCSMPNMTGRPGYRTMEMIGGSSAPYLVCTPCVPLFGTSFNSQKNSRRLELSISKNTPHGRLGQGPGSVDPRFAAGLPFPVPEIPEFVAFRDSGTFFQQFSRDFPGVFLGNPQTHPTNSHSLLEFSGIGVETEGPLDYQGRCRFVSPNIKIRFSPPCQTPAVLTEGFRLQAGLEWKFLLRSTWSGQKIAPMAVCRTYRLIFSFWLREF